MLARAPASDPTTRADVLLSMGTRHPPSRGLVYSLLRPLGRPLPSEPGTRAFGTLTARTLTTGVRRRYGRFPCSDLGLGCPARFWSGFDRALLVWALRLAARVLPLVSDRALTRLCGPLAWLGGLARFFGSEPGSLRLERHSQRGLVGVMEIHAPTRGLDVPALPAVWAASRLVGQARSKARALGDVVPAQPQREALVAAGYRVDAWPPFDPASA
jgi:hypothetical protein